MSIKHWPLKLQLAILLGVIVLVAGYWAGLNVRETEQTFLEKKLQKESQKLFSILTSASIDPIISEDRPVLETIVVESVRVDPNIVFFEIKNAEGLILAAWKRDTPAVLERAFSSDINYEGMTFGTMEVAWDIGPQMDQIDYHASSMRSFIVLLLFGLSCAIVLSLHFLVIRPVEVISRRLKDRNSLDSEALEDRVPLFSRELKALHDSIADRLATEDALRFTRFYIDKAGDATFWLRENGSINYVNEAGLRLLGVKAEDIINRDVSDYIDSLVAKEWEVFWKEVVSEKYFSREFVCRRAGGEEFPGSATVNFIKYEGQEYCCLFLRDMSERKRYEEELKEARQRADEANKAKSNFLASMSHEIRTPMNGVIGMTDVLLQTKLSAEQRYYLGVVKSSAFALLNIINEILDFSKVEAGKFELEHIDFSLKRIATEVCLLLGPMAEQKNLEFICDCDPSIPNLVVGDPGRIQQIITNLVGNAIKFTEKGEVLVRVNVIKNDTHNLFVRIEIKDSGIGIPEDKLQHIFEPFSQADGSITRRFGGTGLGLTISKRLVELMGGHLQVESVFNEGAKFFFDISLPISAVQDDPSLTPVLETFDGERVLVIDDNSTNRTVLSRMLNYWRFSPTCVESGAEGLALLQDGAEKGFSLILLDCHMPQMDGFTFVKECRKRKLAVGVPVIMLTSGGSVGDLDKCQALGIKRYMLKPITEQQLVNLLVQTLRGGGSNATSGSEFEEKKPRRGRGALPILVAEDSGVNQLVAKKLLSSFGFECKIANNGREAVEMLEQEEFSLVLMDVRMPEMDGLEATRAIRESGKGYANIPIVALTANALKGDDDECFQAGMDAYVAKPLDVKQLKEVLETYMERTHEPS